MVERGGERIARLQATPLKRIKIIQNQHIMLGTQEIIIIAIIILILFGGKRIPELMKGLGKGVRYFKDSVNGVDTPEEQQSSKDKPAETQHDEPTR